MLLYNFNLIFRWGRNRIDIINNYNYGVYSNYIFMHIPKYTPKLLNFDFSFLESNKNEISLFSSLISGLAIIHTTGMPVDYSFDLEEIAAGEGVVYTEAQLVALEAAKRERESHPDEIETAHPGYSISQDTFYVGYLKGVGRIYQQTVVDTYSSVAFAKVYTAKIPITAADTLNDRVIPFFEQQSIPVLRVLTDRGTEFCGSPDKHPYELYLQLNEIEHTKTKVRSPQTNRICKRFHQPILNEFYRVAFRKKIYSELDTLQNDLDKYINHYNNERTHQGKRCQGKTPMQTFIDGKKLFAQKKFK